MTEGYRQTSMAAGRFATSNSIEIVLAPNAGKGSVVLASTPVRLIIETHEAP